MRLKLAYIYSLYCMICDIGMKINSVNVYCFAHSYYWVLKLKFKLATAQCQRKQLLIWPLET
jgi:hypothetical protein